MNFIIWWSLNVLLTQENPAALLKEISLVKSRYKSLCDQMVQISREQKESMESIRAALQETMKLSRALQQQTGLEVVSFPLITLFSLLETDTTLEPFCATPGSTGICCLCRFWEDKTEFSSRNAGRIGALFVNPNSQQLKSDLELRSVNRVIQFGLFHRNPYLCAQLCPRATLTGFRSTYFKENRKLNQF